MFHGEIKEVQKAGEEIDEGTAAFSEEGKVKDVENTQKPYYLRERKTLERYQAPLRRAKQRKANFRTLPSSVTQRRSLRSARSQGRKRTYRRRYSDVSDSTCFISSDGEEHFEKERKLISSSDLRRCLSLKSQKQELNRSDDPQSKHGASPSDVEPMQIDSSVRFDSVGGLSDHIAALKEMIVLPLVYPEVFERLKIQPPKGCLFYGPPGTGKTLVARALANECSQGDRKITFFVRNGADCLNEYVGGSEQLLRSLFEQAYQMRPSIIFFDEIDGLAPARSRKQDQVYSSIVSTLLTLMDGLDSRGQVVVIGATNRLDSIDPALRRPRRFDREIFFSLPDREARKEIFRVHTRDWICKPSDTFLEELAEKCVGYSGADIASLCTEAALSTLRRCCPQIYKSTEKLHVDLASLNVTEMDFEIALQKTVAPSQRAVASPGRPLDPAQKPLLEKTLKRILKALQRVFPYTELPVSSRPADWQPMTITPRFLLFGELEYGQSSHFAPAVIHALGKFPVYTLNFSTLLAGVKSPEERCAQLMQEAQRRAPSIIYIPKIHLWWDSAGATLRLTFVSALENIPVFAPVLLLATSDVPYADLPEEIQDIFREGEVFKIQLPQKEERRKFFEDLLVNQAARCPTSKNNAGKGKRHKESSGIARKRRKLQLNEETEVPEEQNELETAEHSELREQLLNDVVDTTKMFTVFELENLYSLLMRCIYQHRDDDDKTKLLQELKKEMTWFKDLL